MRASVPRKHCSHWLSSSRQTRCLVSLPRLRLLANFFVRLATENSFLRGLAGWLPVPSLSRWSRSAPSPEGQTEPVAEGGAVSHSSSGHVSSRCSCIPASVAASSLEQGRSPPTTSCCNCNTQDQNNLALLCCAKANKQLLLLDCAGKYVVTAEKPKCNIYLLVK